ncbi:hypothetical protein CEV34_1238 [Brucella pseudogrignonensis]|uniref:Uncharacterized protein n=1 Tax=Brucella pseudogrignonensis TaxID=419475 RepID=A0A256GMG0_9HYPH|nr:hypothetical protein CEV34_1238 [Brucella pseudogrignonensis]
MQSCSQGSALKSRIKSNSRIRSVDYCFTGITPLRKRDILAM